MFRYPRIRLTEIEAVRMATHREIFFHQASYLSHVIKDKNRIWACLARWNDIAVVARNAQ